MTKRQFTHKKHSIKWPMVALLCFFFFAACSSKDDPTTEIEETGEADIAANEALFYKLTRVENIAATQEDNSTTDASPVYYSLDNNTLRDASHQKGRNWDLAFGGLYNSFLSGNNGSDSKNLGTGSNASGGIMIVEKAFDEVTDIPADSEFKTGSNLIGTDDNGDFGDGIGWYLYDYDGTIVREGASEDQHVAYALAEGLKLKNGTEVAPRTVIVKTAKGHYAKIKMISCYKDLYSAALWKKDSPKMYFTFEFLMVPAGSTKFEQ